MQNDELVVEPVPIKARDGDELDADIEYGIFGGWCSAERNAVAVASRTAKLGFQNSRITSRSTAREKSE